MSTRSLSIDSQHGVERLFIRLTDSQKGLITSLREDKKAFIRNEDGEYKLFKNKEFSNLLNKETVEKLIDQEFLEYVNPTSNKIVLSTLAR